ncbi:MAPEG family protein [Undibacterium sp.]|jgi:glutathione S-transferase|uniref:MAPEG family protein n=1 Tax=Undibacterium sp. TaxID=1914977 RepID=UPI002BECB192|nr:MAPEG family protein [Undibacterium sp.]HTD05269.1 MAPEG family protein [Undibacterium sp.]
MQIQWTAWATIAALLVFLWTILNVAKARGTYKVSAPAVDGPPGFLRAMRVQVNTAEQIILFLPALWMCAYLLSDRWAALGGAAWVAGRIWYALGYYRDPGKRSAGFLIALLATLGLLAGTAVGLLR